MAASGRGQTDLINPEQLKTQLDEAALALQARRHYAETSADAAFRSTQLQKFHHYYAPLNGDQWPEDKVARPGMIHLTHNIIQPAVDTESRIESLLPRASLLAGSPDMATRVRAEAAEKILTLWLELSDWETWLNDAAKVKSMYGKVVLKPIWNKKDKRGDVSIIETPQNLRLGYAASDYSVLDWALYEYAISPMEAMRKFPDLDITVEGRGEKLNVLRGGTHDDPLSQLSGGRGIFRNRNDRQPTDYEGKQVRVWDYWCKDKDDNIVNAFFVEGVLAKAPTHHNYYPDLPFIVVEHDHEPGSSEGLGDIEPLIDIQYELNRALSHWAQLINDEIDPAYQIDAESIPSGSVPRGGEILAAGEDHQIRPIEKSVQTFPVESLIDALMKSFHFRSGLSEIMFSLPPGAQTAGRALAIQVESSANRIDPRRKRLYKGIKELLIFWSEMGEKINPKIEVGFDEQGEPVEKGLDEVFKGFRRWRFVAPEITPRDNLEAITAVVNKLTNKLISLEDAMDELGVDSPLEMIKKIEIERLNPKLYPGDTQAYVAVLSMLQQYQAQQQAMSGGAPGVPDGAPVDPNASQGTLQNEAQRSQPQGIQGQNGSDVPQPATAAGGPPPPGAPLTNQTLIRAQPNGSAQTLQQIRVTNG
jgi:hypothetical protein